MTERLQPFDATAQQLGMTGSQLRWLQHTGRAPRSVLIGKRRMFRQSDVDAWVDAQFQSVERDQDRVPVGAAADSVESGPEHRS